jgi:hypothetical protein
MLNSPTYIGQHKCSGIVVGVPRIIEDETFHAAQRMSAENRKRLVGRPSNKYLLRGFLWCAKCGRRCTTFPNNGYANYRCNNIEYKPYRRICFAPQIRQTIIENVAWREIWSRLKDPALLLKLAQAYYDGLAKPEAEGLEKLERESAKLRAKITTTRNMLQDNLMPYAKGKADIRACEERIRQIEAELAAAGSVATLPPLYAAEAACRRIAEGPEPTHYETRRPILERLIDLKLYYDKGRLQITGKVPVPGDAALAGGGKKNCYRGQHRHIQRAQRAPIASGADA